MSTEAADDVVGEAATAETEPVMGADPTRPRFNSLLLVAIVLVVAAAACAGWFGLQWYQAAHDTSAATAQARDDVLRAADQGAINFTTLDYRNVQQGLDQWRQSATGDLLDQFNQGATQFGQAIQQAKTVTKGEIQQAAITELDVNAGKASAIIEVSVTTTVGTGKPSQKSLLLEAKLTRTSDGWKFSSLSQAPIPAS